MAVIGIDHINIHTTDLATTIEFYTTVLGFEHRPKPVRNHVGAWLYAGDSAIVHLNDVDALPAESASAVNHVAFEIDDLDELTSALDLAGVDYQLDVRDELGLTQVFTTDPNGVAIELQARH